MILTRFDKYGKLTYNIFMVNELNEYERQWISAAGNDPNNPKWQNEWRFLVPTSAVDAAMRHQRASAQMAWGALEKVNEGDLDDAQYQIQTWREQSAGDGRHGLPLEALAKMVGTDMLPDLFAGNLPPDLRPEDIAAAQEALVELGARPEVYEQAKWMSDFMANNSPFGEKPTSE